MQSPRKTLSRNPNGVYRWQGAGSSRPRNRYQSPGFSPRPQQNQIKLSPPKTPLTTDTKRRRVGDEAEDSTFRKAVTPSTSTICFPVSDTNSPVAGPSATVAKGKDPAPAPPVTPKANGTQPRLRTSGLTMKPTAPAIPSPLRQAWKQNDSPPQSSPASRPTRAADFMTELIKEVTPTKKADVSNPYQTARPVKPPVPVRKPAPKRPKPSTKSVEEPKEEKSEVSAQAIIEATVPKGSKRSRPPPEMEKATRVEQALSTEASPPESNGFQPPRFHSSVRSTAVVKTITVREDEESPSKRRKTPPAPKALFEVQEVVGVEPSEKFTRPVEVIEPDDDTPKFNSKPSTPVPEITFSPPSSTSKSLFSSVKTTVPKEPSKLRYSYQADKVEVKPADATHAPSSVSLFTPAPIVLPTAPMPVPPAKGKLSPKDEVLAMDVDELPKYTFSSATTTTSPAGPSSLATRNIVLSMPASSLPAYEFKPVAVPVRVMNGFNWTAAGLKAPTAAGQKWRCKLCDLENPATATDKCTICDAPRPAPTASAAPASAWRCKLCELENPASSTDKCTICDAPRPASAASTAPASSAPATVAPVTAMDWSTAGFAPPKPQSGT
ncbi:hypothetical protein PAXRUDRAFT_129113 [Paxillus rubicundulus Ve08.2h10]|uniref:RanBP2-type domain-containing protein n=1 Tax=Paxillus rubicundulus Ve08.2h10 TaxID=930991 RepID=A0A0D0EAW7_9AGAM|nr:hypothetical protein PAXRUDRAFT_129113 [Paxillus rubicundulus Ve08.2h10]